MVRGVIFTFLLITLGCFCLETEWKDLMRTEAEQQVSFLLSLEMQNLPLLDRLTNSLTTPGSPMFRKWKTMHELNEITRPDEQKTNNLLLWLSQQNLKAKHFGNFIRVSGTARDAERAFKVEYRTFTNNYDAKIENIHRSVIRPTIPAQFTNFIQIITGISDFPMPPKRNKEPPKEILETDDVKFYYTVPQTLYNQYGVPNVTAVASSPKSSQGVAEFGSKYGIVADDLTVFMNLTNGDVNAKLNYTVGNFIDGAYSEASLDVQYIMAMAPGVPTSLYVIDGWILDFVALIQERLEDNLHVPSVFSISFGWPEPDQCSAPTEPIGGSCGSYSNAQYIEACNIGFQKMGLAGISVFVSSGDSGTAPNCFTRPPTLNAEYPTSSNYVTSVGGTMYSAASILSTNIPPFCTESSFLTGPYTCAGNGTEVVCQTFEALITSGGGFSNVTTMPAWQTSVVQSYLNSGAELPDPSMYNPQGRAVPDISALAHHYMIVLDGRPHAIDGTSASSPVVAGMFAMINDYLLERGENTLGFVNPALYAAYSNNSAIVQDVTVGYNGPHVNAGACGQAGFGAYAGWDAATGLGTPNYTQLLQALS